MNTIDEFDSLDFTCLLTNEDQQTDLSLGSIDTGQPNPTPQVSQGRPDPVSVQQQQRPPHDDNPRRYGVGPDDDLHAESTGESTIKYIPRHNQREKPKLNHVTQYFF